MLQWLEKEACGKQMVYCIIRFALISFVLQIAAFIIAALFTIDVSSMSKNMVIITNYRIFYVMIIPIIMEETVFRLFPVFLAKKLKFSKKEILVLVAISSAVFGCLHGNAYNIFFQGVSGFLFSLLFLKCGGLQEHYGKAFVSSSASHYLFNSIVSIMILL
ncbi:MAG: CPBP family glutamic-type intramembrane protease [Candidatus Parcubacteria bacterium]|nr:CPBP family glutamic-type intramembrane protease [Candidatus Parcubacteria bacterium]